MDYLLSLKYQFLFFQWINSIFRCGKFLCSYPVPATYVTSVLPTTIDCNDIYVFSATAAHDTSAAPSTVSTNPADGKIYRISNTQCSGPYGQPAAL